MNDVVSRLRASKLQSSCKTYLEGFHFGEEWAKNAAEASDLQQLSKLYDEWSEETAMGGWEGYFLEDTPWNHRGLAGNVFDGIFGAYANSDEFSFWQEVFGDDPTYYLSDPQAVKGFAEGALKIWREVESLI